MNRFLLPGVFVVLVAFLFIGLQLNPRQVPSPLIGKAAPAFQLAQLYAPERSFSPRDMLGEVWLLNVWASWCVSCRDEHPLLVEFARANTVALVGLNYKDEPEDAQAWLARFGDPYRLSLTDLDGRVGIDFGVYGVPETFVIDKAGVIRYKHVGPLTAAALAETILPLVRELQKG
ncbi:MAG: DsbE family thiol:disulfide interchange protein [Chromatiales bacterium]